MSTIPAFEVNKELSAELVRIFNFLGEKINWDQARRRKEGKEERKAMQDLCLSLSKEFFTKFGHLHQVRETEQEYREKYWSFCVIQVNDQICLSVPYDFVLPYQEKLNDQIDLFRALQGNMTIEEIVLSVKEEIGKSRPKLKPLEVVFLKTVAAFRYPYNNKLPPPTTNQIAREGGMSEATAKTYKKDLISQGFIFDYLLPNPWSLGFDLAIVEPSKVESRNEVVLWTQPFQNKFFSLVQRAQLTQLPTKLPEPVFWLSQLVVSYNLDDLEVTDEKSFLTRFATYPKNVPDPLFTFSLTDEKPSISREELIILKKLNKKGIAGFLNLKSFGEEFSKPYISGVIRKFINSGSLGFFPRIKKIGLSAKYAVYAKGSAELIDKLILFLRQTPLVFIYSGDEGLLAYLALHPRQIYSFQHGLDKLSRSDPKATVLYATHTKPESNMSFMIQAWRFDTEIRMGSLLHQLRPLEN